jgi:hypothetical protein
VWLWRRVVQYRKSCTCYGSGRWRPPRYVPCTALGQSELLAARTVIRSPSTRVTCATSIGPSCGWSLLTDRAAHSDAHSRSQPQEQVTSQRGFSVLINGSWASAAATPSSHEATSRPLALPRPLRVSLLPCLANGFLLGRGDRAARENSGPEDSGQYPEARPAVHHSIT